MSSGNYTQFKDEGNPPSEGNPPPMMQQRQMVYALPEQPHLPPYSDMHTTVVVTNPSHQTIIRTGSAVPKDYFGLALFVTLCCFLPFGIVALIKSSEVRTRAAHGDQLGAQQSAQHARTFSMIGLGIGVASWAISIVILVIYIAAVVAVVEGDPEVITQDPIVKHFN